MREAQHREAFKSPSKAATETADAEVKEFFSVLATLGKWANHEAFTRQFFVKMFFAGFAFGVESAQDAQPLPS